VIAAGPKDVFILLVHWTRATLILVGGEMKMTIKATLLQFSLKQIFVLVTENLPKSLMYRKSAKNISF